MIYNLFIGVSSCVDESKMSYKIFFLEISLIQTYILAVSSNNTIYGYSGNDELLG